jgi:hypothetical protein
MNTKPRDTAEHHAARRKRRWLGCLAILLVPVLLLAVLLGLFGLRLMEKPQITRDYLAEFNERYEGVPESDKAWPLYKQAIILRINNPHPKANDSTWISYPDWSDWDEAKERIEALVPTLELIRQAASKPVFGKALSLEEDPDIVKAQGGPGMFGAMPSFLDEEPLWMAMLTMDDLGRFRKMAKDLAQDTLIAIEDGQAERAIENLEAMLGLAAHAAESETVVNLLTRGAIDALACGTVSIVLNNNPQAFTEPDLARLQQAFMTIGLDGLREDGGLTRIPIKLAMQRAFYMDMVQRIYSDDGTGDGRLTLDGTMLIFSPAPGPIAVVLAESRKEAVETYDESYERFIELARMQPFERGDDIEQMQAEQAEYEANGFLQARQPLGSMVTNWPMMIRALDRINTERDAAITVIALHRYRLADGDFPATLDELVPKFLPTLPLDPMDGKPLRYILKPDGPVLYSIGADGIDGGGVKAEEEQDAYPSAERPDDGDWVLYPVAMPVEDE